MVTITSFRSAIVSLVVMIFSFSISLHPLPCALSAAIMFTTLTTDCFLWVEVLSTFDTVLSRLNKADSQFRLFLYLDRSRACPTVMPLLSTLATVTHGQKESQAESGSS